jgi:hypothetical protein
VLCRSCFQKNQAKPASAAEAAPASAASSDSVNLHEAEAISEPN